MRFRFSALLILLLACATQRTVFAAWGANYDLDALPNVPPGFKAMFVAKEPDLLHTVCICFDEKGRLFAGGGPQFRWPKPDTPKDYIKILIDKDGDGKADEFKIFAEGFNCIQAMAWKGKDLWVCHAPCVTICRDLDGDDVADEFIDVFTDLGPLRHGLHGFNWAPDGKLYMSQGNNTCTKDAPKVWRDLMHVESDAPDVQPLRKYTKAEWKVKYLEPHNSESEGGILRCDPEGKNCEIWSRGMRNPWDIAFDDTFTWTAGDNDDGPESDRVFSPFYGSHWGKRHAWAYSWTGDENQVTLQISSLFPHANGSAVGVIYYTAPHFPEEYRNGFFMGDSDGEKVYFYRPEYDGAHMKATLKPFCWTPAIGKGSLFMPTDVEAGPDGALYVVGWGSTYGSKWAPYHKGKDENAKINEGRIFRISYEKAPAITREQYLPAKRAKKYADWTLDELMEDMGHQIPVWRVNAQDEIVRRGKTIRGDLETALNSGKLSKGQETWSIWALGRIEPADKEINAAFVKLLDSANANLRLQAVRILEFRKAMETSSSVAKLLSDKEPRIRFEAALTLWHMGAKDQVTALQTAAATETDRLVYYAIFRGLHDNMTPDALKTLAKDERAGVRRAAILALLEGSHLKSEEVLEILSDKDKATQKIAVMWLVKQGKDLPVDSMLARLSSPDADTRLAVLQCMGRSKLSGDAYKKLAKHLENASGEERALTVKALAADPNSGATLWAELDNKDEAVRQAATDGLSAQEKTLPKFVMEKLESGTIQQKSGALVALATLKKFDWQADEVKMKVLNEVFATNDLAARRATAAVLTRAKNLPKSPGAALAGEIAKKAAADSDKEIRESGQTLCKTLGIAVSTAKVEGSTADQVLALLSKANPENGKEIFFRKDTPGCYNCHKIDDRGTAVGPDLSDLALRADAKNILESIFEPSKVIIEGFQPQLVKTTDGKVVSGLVKEDADEVLVIYESSGRAVEIRKALIASRKTLNVSFMPDNFSELLKPNEAADVLSWLLTMKKAKEKK
jgi:quinoprotein glucose dehydrogenase